MDDHNTARTQAVMRPMPKTTVCAPEQAGVDGESPEDSEWMPPQRARREKYTQEWYRERHSPPCV